MNAVVELQPRAVAADTGRMSVPDVIRHVHAVQEVMQAVMKEGVHYGMVPGTDKPMLYKQGAEKLCLAFKIGDEYRIEDLSTAEVSRYRITCVGIHQPTGTVLGQGVGECSSAEEKYKWRKAVCKEEFEAAPVDMRRRKFGRKAGGHYTVDQIRVESADVANTVLKMAAKRAKVAMTLNVTAAGDIFGQDLEELDALLREHLSGEEQATQLQMTRDEWVGKAAEAATTEALAKVMREGVKVFQAARDRDGYQQFAAAVQKRGAALKGAGNA
jgi:hypothetical protein